jgi:hypothetical protein
MASPTWTLDTLLDGFHGEIEHRLESIRKTMGHPGVKGDASERVWRELFGKYLPERYKTITAHVCDSDGNFSEQIDVVIIDRQYSPLLFNKEDVYVVPAESVYAVFEAKQTATAPLVKYAQEKVESVRKLKRTSKPIVWLMGSKVAKEPPPIIGGYLSFQSDWKPAMGDAFKAILESVPNTGPNSGYLDMGCVAAHGHFALEDGRYSMVETEKAATAFLFKLISRLQQQGTVPMIDIDAYAKWLAP